MKLTPEEERMLEGKNGKGCKLAMEILVEVGRAFGAERMVPVQSAHTVLSSYKGIMDAGIEALQRFVELGARASVNHWRVESSSRTKNHRRMRKLSRGTHDFSSLVLSGFMHALFHDQKSVPNLCRPCKKKLQIVIKSKEILYSLQVKTAHQAQRSGGDISLTENRQIASHEITEISNVNLSLTSPSTPRSTAHPLMKARRSALITSACVVHMPCGNPL